jgi:hypothetical protein
MSAPEDKPSLAPWLGSQLSGLLTRRSHALLISGAAVMLAPFVVMIAISLKFGKFPGHVKFRTSRSRWSHCRG